MKSISLIAGVVVVLLVLGGGSPAAGAARSVKEDLAEIQREIEAKVRRGARSEADLARELDRLDALLVRHWDEKTDDVAEVLFAKAELFAGPLKQPEAAIAVLQQLKFSFGGTAPSARADARIASLKQSGRADAQAAQLNMIVPTGLAVGESFPDFDEADLDGQPLSVSLFQGRVVLIDFWATWCGPCVGELPSVLRAFRKYHDSGFEVIGISLDQDRGKLTGFISQRGIPWPQYFDGGGWGNKLARQFGIRSIPATFLLDRDGVIIAKNLRGSALDRAVAAALSK